MWKLRNIYDTILSEKSNIALYTDHDHKARREDVYSRSGLFQGREIKNIFSF